MKPFHYVCIASVAFTALCVVFAGAIGLPVIILAAFAIGISAAMESGD